MDLLLPCIAAANHDSWLNLIRHQPVVDQEAGLRARGSSPPHPTLALTDLSHAFQPGHACTQYRLHASDGLEPAELIFALGSAAAAFWVLEQMDWSGGAPDHEPRILILDHGQLEIRRSALPAIRVFSPLHLHRLKRLERAPKRWTIPHVIRALVNGQCADLRCNGQYTDDYARDAAEDFGRGEIRSALAFAQRIVESPSGWWCSANGDRVSVCCHHFDNNSFRLDLDARPSTPEVRDG